MRLRIDSHGRTTMTKRLATHPDVAAASHVLVGWDKDANELVLRLFKESVPGSRVISRRIGNADGLCAGLAYRHFGILPETGWHYYRAEVRDGAIYAKRELEEATAPIPAGATTC
ncbi:MAG: hypothetical protein LLG01_00835 [Planctomycetaceae bacterium]|nr:hypothetical protein [Planctomycetaceae bacterium]